MRLLFRMLGFLVLVAGAVPAHADFPEHPIRLIVPFAPSGTVDGIARLAAVEFGKALGQAVVIENRPGSGGTIGIMAAASSAPDGYTLLLGNIALASAPALYPKSGISPAQFEPVSLIGRSAYILAVKNDFPANSVSELVALAKANPGKYNYSSAGAGSAIHLAAELFKSRAGIDIVHVQQRGPAISLLSGEVDMMVQSAGVQGDGRASWPIAVTSLARFPGLPDLPTFAESGIHDYGVAGWYGLFAPAKTPPEALRTLQSAAATALKSPGMRQQLARYQEVPWPRKLEDMLDGKAGRWTELHRRCRHQVE